MAEFEAKKLTILRILDILKEYSDYEHPLKHEDIINYLSTLYDIEIDRKTGKEIPGEAVKDRTNCHIILLAKNEEGRRDINEILSIASIDGFYGQPRIDIDLLFGILDYAVAVITE